MKRKTLRLRTETVRTLAASNLSAIRGGGSVGALCTEIDESVGGPPTRKAPDPGL
jgi:hypothetical protein